MEKFDSELKKEIYEVISRKIKNPLITEMFSITDVVTSKDLSHAKVYFSVFSISEEKKKITADAIVGESKRIRHELALTMRSRTVPELHFIPDGSMEYGDKMDKLFKEIENSGDNK